MGATAQARSHRSDISQLGSDAGPRLRSVPGADQGDAADEGRPARQRERQPVRLTRRGRIVLVSGVVAVILAGLWLGVRQGAVATSNAGIGVSGTNRESVIVGPHDSLWTIATRSNPKADPRITVRRIIDVNGLPDSIVRPGQRIYLPR